MRPARYFNCMATVIYGKVFYIVLLVLYSLSAFASPFAAAVYGNSVAAGGMYVVAVVINYFFEYTMLICFPLFGLPGDKDDDLEKAFFIPDIKKTVSMASSFPVDRKTVLRSFWNTRSIPVCIFAVSTVILGICCSYRDVLMNEGSSSVGLTVLHLYFILMSEIYSRRNGKYSISVFRGVGTVSISFAVTTAVFISNPNNNVMSSFGAGMYFTALGVITLADFLICRHRALNEPEDMTVSGEKIMISREVRS